MKPEDKLIEAVTEIEYLQLKEGVRFTPEEIGQMDDAITRLKQVVINIEEIII